MVTISGHLPLQASGSGWLEVSVCCGGEAAPPLPPANGRKRGRCPRQERKDEEKDVEGSQPTKRLRGASTGTPPLPAGDPEDVGLLWADFLEVLEGCKALMDCRQGGFRPLEDLSRRSRRRRANVRLSGYLHK